MEFPPPPGNYSARTYQENKFGHYNSNFEMSRSTNLGTYICIQHDKREKKNSVKKI